MRRIKTEIVIDKEQKQPKILIITDEVTGEVKRVYEMLTAENRLNCFSERGVERVAQSDIIRVFSQNGGVYAVTAHKTYSLRERLYEVEEVLDRSVFVRISKGELVNSRKIIRLNIKMSGTIGIELEGGIVSFVSRRFVPRIKEFFGL